MHQARCCWLPYCCGIQFACAESTGDNLYVLVQITGRLNTLFLKYCQCETVSTGAFWHGNHFSVHPLDGFISIGKFRGIVLNQHVIALIEGKPGSRHDTNICNPVFGGSNNRRHITHIANVLFTCQHSVYNNSALQTDLELNR